MLYTFKISIARDLLSPSLFGQLIVVHSVDCTLLVTSCARSRRSRPGDRSYRDVQGAIRRRDFHGNSIARDLLSPSLSSQLIVIHSLNH